MPFSVPSKLPPEVVAASFKLLFESNPVPMFVYNWDTLQFVAANDAACERYGYSRAQFLRMAIPDIRASRDLTQIQDIMRSTHGEIRGLASQHKRADGTVMEVVVYSRPMRLNDENIGLAAIFDVTEQRQAEANATYIALHDMLTDLPNRLAFEDYLRFEMDQALKAGQKIAVLCLDLDKFKEVNDSFGHGIGDALLTEVAQRLKAAAGDSFLSRIGGDEFLLIATGSTAASTVALSIVAHRLEAAIARPFLISGYQLNIGLSVGVAIFPNDGADAVTIVANADTALYNAKHAGRGVVRFFDREMKTILRAQRDLESDLNQAVARGELLLHFQPVMRNGSDIVGLEALVRWYQPQRGMLQPGLFIPLAEKKGLISQIGAWVLREACREAVSWTRPLQLAVNLSAMQFRDDDLVKTVHGVLLETGLAAQRLELEVTESALIADPDRTLLILRRLKALGVKIVLDDFGTGYSSLCYLQSFPFDKIKIGRTFVANVGRKPQSAAIIRCIIGLGRELGLTVAAAGVETDEQFAFLARHGCEECQGFLWSRPMPISEYAATLGRSAPTAPALRAIA